MVFYQIWAGDYLGVFPHFGDKIIRQRNVKQISQVQEVRGVKGGQ